MKLAVMSLVGLAVLVSPLAWAEGKKSSLSTSDSASCKIEPGNKGFRENSVLVYGDLKVKVSEEHYGPRGAEVGSEYYSIYDLKAPGYLKRGIKLKHLEKFTDTICGSEVSIFEENGLTVTVF